MQLTCTHCRGRHAREKAQAAWLCPSINALLCFHASSLPWQAGSAFSIQAGRADRSRIQVTILIWYQWQFLLFLQYIRMTPYRCMTFHGEISALILTSGKAFHVPNIGKWVSAAWILHERQNLFKK